MLLLSAISKKPELTSSPLCTKVWLGDLKIAFSFWNIGEVLGVLDRYFRRGWLSREDYELAKLEFLGETLKMLRLRTLKIIPG